MTVFNKPICYLVAWLLVEFINPGLCPRGFIVVKPNEMSDKKNVIKGVYCIRKPWRNNPGNRRYPRWKLNKMGSNVKDQSILEHRLIPQGFANLP